MKLSARLAALFKRKDPVEELQTRLKDVSAQADLCDKYFQLEKLRVDIREARDKQDAKSNLREVAHYAPRVAVWLALVVTAIAGMGGPVSWAAGAGIVALSLIPDFMDGDYHGRQAKREEKIKPYKDMLTETDKQYEDIRDRAPVADLLRSSKLHRLIDPSTRHGAAIQKRIAEAFNTQSGVATTAVAAPAASVTNTPPPPPPASDAGPRGFSVH